MPHSLWNRFYHDIKKGRLNREHFKRNAKLTLDDLYQKFDDLCRGKKTIRENLKPEVIENLKKLSELKDDLQNKFDELEGASSDSWQEVKDKFSQSAKAFSKTLSNISKNFN